MNISDKNKEKLFEKIQEFYKSEEVLNILNEIVEPGVLYIKLREITSSEYEYFFDSNDQLEISYLEDEKRWHIVDNFNAHNAYDINKRIYGIIICKKNILKKIKEEINEYNKINSFLENKILN